MQKNIIQLHDTTPEQLVEEILQGVKKELEILKQEFQPKEPTEYLTRKEVAKLLKVDLSTIFNWTRKKRLKAYGIGHRVYFKRHELYESIIPLNS